jgi:O-antigen ligase
MVPHDLNRMPGKPHTVTSQFAYVLLVTMALTIGTGAYVELSPLMYVLLALAVFVYGMLAATGVYKVNVQSNLILLLYVAFLLANALRDTGNPIAGRLYLNFLVGICAFLIVVKLQSLDPEARFFRYVPLLSLAIIAGGIVLQLNGIIISRRDGEAMGGVDEGLLLRPGGFMNPNMSAALSLIWLFCTMESKAQRSQLTRAACIGICIFTLSITQSRAAMLCLAAYLVVKMFEKGANMLRFSAVALACAAVALTVTGHFGAFDEIIDSILLRFQGDGSSTERFFLLRTALAAFSDSPLIGHGMRGMFRIAGLGTHNEIVEWLVNFGVIGLFVMLLVILRFYYVHSFKYVCLCLLPTLLFSHNFFETTSFQVALAYAFFVAVQNKSAASAKAVAWRPAYVPFAIHGAVPPHVMQGLQ